MKELLILERPLFCFVSKALEQCVNNMSVKLAYSLFKGWIAIST